MEQKKACCIVNLYYGVFGLDCIPPLFFLTACVEDRKYMHLVVCMLYVFGCRKTITLNAVIAFWNYYFWVPLQFKAIEVVSCASILGIPSMAFIRMDSRWIRFTVTVCDLCYTEIIYPFLAVLSYVCLTKQHRGHLHMEAHFCHFMEPYLGPRAVERDSRTFLN